MRSSFFSSVILNSKGPPISGPLLFLLEQAAAKYLRVYRGADRVQFRHPNPPCEGLIKYKKEGALGAFSGTIFEAYVVDSNGKITECEFILRDGRENITPDDMEFAIFSELTDEGQQSGMRLDIDQIRNVEVSKAISH